MNIQLFQHSSNGMLGSRGKALDLRNNIINILTIPTEKIILDFANTNPTHSFLDELIGILVLEQGIELLKRISFLNMQESDKVILKNIIASRIKTPQK